MLCAFSGWNDAAEGATGALDHLLETLGVDDNAAASQLIAEIDSEE